MAELVRGRTTRSPRSVFEIRVRGRKADRGGATLGDEHGRIHGVEWVAHPGTPTLPAIEVSKQAAADHRLAVDLGAMPEAVHRVTYCSPCPSARRPARFGAVAAPFVAVHGLDGAEVASYTITGLDAESAVVALELYRRRGAWKVRAVGQGYAGGLGELLTDQGLPQAHQLAGSINEAVAQGPWPAPWQRPHRARRTATAPARRPHRPSAPTAAVLRHRAPPAPYTAATSPYGAVPPQPAPQPGYR